MRKKYLNYTTQDFLTDDYFLYWQKTGKNDAFWENYIKSQPNNLKDLREAIKIYSELSDEFVRQKLGPQDLQQEWHKLKGRHAKQIQSRSRTKPAIKWIGIAASLLFVLTFGGLYFYAGGNSEPIKIYSNTSQTDTLIKLEDATLVHLSKGSQLEVLSKFDQLKERKVRLKGEGYFDVTKASTPRNQFSIQCGDSEIRVLGTKFNVKSYLSDSLSIALEEGSIEFHYGTSDQTLKHLQLAPGNQLKYSFESRNVEILESKNIETLSSWRFGFLNFTDEKVKHVLREIEHYLNVEISLNDNSLNDKKINGKIPIDDIDSTIKVLEEVLNVKFYKTQNRHYEIELQ